MERSFTVYDGTDVIEQGKDDVSWEQVRAARDQALKNSDWTAVKDRTMSQAWKDYRSALRDLPQVHAEATAAAAAWPEAPE